MVIEAEFHENPLVPNERLREIFLAMTAMRDHDVPLKGRKSAARPAKKLHSTRGEEACRVSTAIGLQPGDLISDSHPARATGPLAGVAGDGQRPPGGRRAEGGHTINDSKRHLPWIKGEGERVWLAMGAAVSLKMSRQPNLVLAYAHGRLLKREWRHILRIASRLELPIVFMVLPLRAAGRKQPRAASSTLGTSLNGVPIIAVDASDAVALYRVAQESFGRIRGGGGPVLIESVAFVKHRAPMTTATDPLLRMRDLLLSKKIVTPNWLDKAARSPQRQARAPQVPEQVRA